MYMYKQLKLYNMEVHYYYFNRYKQRDKNKLLLFHYNQLVVSYLVMQLKLFICSKKYIQCAVE
jgi:type I site-specific restriction-modification system R (restriction) subunit